MNHCHPEGVKGACCQQAQMTPNRSSHSRLAKLSHNKAPELHICDNRCGKWESLLRGNCLKWKISPFVLVRYVVVFLTSHLKLYCYCEFKYISKLTYYFHSLFVSLFYFVALSMGEIDETSMNKLLYLAPPEPLMACLSLKNITPLVSYVKCECDPWQARQHHKANPPRGTQTLSKKPENSEDNQRGGHLLNQALLRHRVWWKLIH